MILWLSGNYLFYFPFMFLTLSAISIFKLTDYKYVPRSNEDDLESLILHRDIFDREEDEK